MKISAIPAREMDKTLQQRWQEIQASNPALANPYFCVEYTEAVAAVRDDVFVGIMEEDNRVVGFFPFQRKSKKIAGPVGGRLSDYQGVIISPEQEWSVEDLMQGCDLNIWDFDHLLAAQQPLESFYEKIASSPVMNLAEGFERYVQIKRESGSKKIKQLQGLWRKFERDIGEFRLELYSENSAAFQQVIQWKHEQCLRTGVVDFMSWGWTTGMLEQIWKKRSDNFAGMLSVLYHEDEIIAAHMGMRSATVCHWWFPGYNHSFSKFSPGGLLLLKVAEEIAGQGIISIDLGKGDDAYKSWFTTGSIALAEGSVMLPSITTSLRKAQTASDTFLRHSPLALPVRAPLKAAKKLKRRLMKSG
ncbi:MAG TPA: GNAT family N-acetyltransferase [Chromatiales bacterium]|nr:GNAT family N-acetyltransferase [Thiotrichales bacterium]HIP67135.1 GNAT family N-acetyltransferase [Chromatiales bacterium]